jgi:hypothetical protein
MKLAIGFGKPKTNLLYHTLGHPSTCPACNAEPFDLDTWIHERFEEMREEIDNTILEEFNNAN